jgi:hypothetical protein
MGRVSDFQQKMEWIPIRWKQTCPLKFHLGPSFQKGTNVEFVHWHPFELCVVWPIK